MKSASNNKFPNDNYYVIIIIIVIFYYRKQNEIKKSNFIGRWLSNKNK